MHHQVPVGVIDGREDIQKNLDTAANRQPVMVAVNVQLYAVHILHDDVAQAVARKAQVQHSYDSGMLQRREQLALLLDLCVGGSGK